MTLIGVLIGQYAIHRRQEKQAEKERETLRDSLAVELRTADEWLEQLLYITHDLSRAKENTYGFTEEQEAVLFESELKAQLGVYRFTADKQLYSETVFQSNAGKIGELDPETAEAVVRTYGQIKTLHQSLQNLKETLNYEVFASNSGVDWETGSGLDFGVFAAEAQIKSSISMAIISQKITLLRLGDSISESDRVAFLFAYTHMRSQSKEHEQFQAFVESYIEKYDLSSVDDLVANEGDHPLAQK